MPFLEKKRLLIPVLQAGVNGKLDREAVGGLHENCLKDAAATIKGAAHGAHQRRVERAAERELSRLEAANTPLVSIYGTNH